MIFDPNDRNIAFLLAAAPHSPEARNVLNMIAAIAAEEIVEGYEKSKEADQEKCPSHAVSKYILWKEVFAGKEERIRELLADFVEAHRDKKQPASAK